MEVRPADRGLREVLVDVRVVEEAEGELHPQQPPRRLVDALLGDAAVLDEVEEQLDALLPAELVDARVQEQLHPPMRVEALDAPGASGQHLVADMVVVDQLPVGEDHPVVAEPLP